MKYKDILKTVLENGHYIIREYSLISMYNYNLSLNKKDLNELLDSIPENRKEKFEIEFNLFMNGVDKTKTYNEHGIKYWDYVGEKLINSYPHFYPNFEKNIKEHSKNNVLHLGNNEYTNQQPCISCIQFQNTHNKLYISVLQRSCDVNLGFLADLYHLKLFAEKTKMQIENISILYGNIHIYENNLNETLRYIKDDGLKMPYKFIQNNKKR